MKFNTIIPKGLKYFFDEELQYHKEALLRGNLTKAWQHLERAHILGQAYPREHTLAHWEMLKFGIRIKSIREIAGQLPRLLVGGVKSFIGKIPVGNTGGANVPALLPMKIPEDLENILQQHIDP